jgi:cbb3-type cytochrome oxidase cytochrome c subunit
MSAQNRDTERLYPPGKLSFHFAVWSTLLVVVMIWMLWQDHDRPWKDYQRRFREKQLDVAIQKKRNYETKTENLPALLKAEKDAKARLAALPETNPELRDLEGRLKDLRQKQFDAEAYEKEVKGLQAPLRYLYEVAEGAGPRAAALDKFNRMSSELHRAHQRTGDAQADLDAVTNRIKAIRQPYEDEVKKAEKALADLRSIELLEGGLTQKFQKNQWRNWAVIDFIAKSIEIKQVVLKDIHDNWNFATNVKVDRCMTCHTGVDNPEMSDESIATAFAQVIVESQKVPFTGKFTEPGDLEGLLQEPAFQEAFRKYKKQHGFESWMQPHPGLDLISGSNSKHPVERVGCTVCHAGVGWATDFSRAAHTAQNHEQLHEWEQKHDRKPPQFVDFPMLAKEYVQGQCFKCHKQGFGWPVPYQERLDHGYVPQVHKDVTTGKERILGPLEAYGPYRLPPAPGVVDGPRSRVASVQRAHLEGRLGRLQDPEGSARSAEEVMKEVHEDFSAKERQEDPSRRLEWSEERYKAGLEALRVRDYGWDAARYDRGEESIRRYGCQGCHKIQDFGEAAGQEWPRIAPTLSYLADKVNAAWLERWIKHPDAFRIDTRMPSFFWFVPKDRDWQPVDQEGKTLATPRPVPVMDSHLWDRDEHIRALGRFSTPQDHARMSVQVAALTTYLMTQGRSRAKQGDPEFDAAYAKDPIPGDWERGRKTVGNEGVGCVACHIVPEIQDADGNWVADKGERFGGEPAKGPRLDGLGSKLNARWLNAWLERPRHYTAHTQMPDMRWRDEVTATGEVVRTAEQARADVVAYLLRYKNEAFDNLPGVGWDDSWNDILKDMYEEYFGRTKMGDLRRPSEVGGEFESKGQPTILAMVGEKLMGRNGCFGCHEVQGHEEEQPIGTELTRWGIKDLHQLEFAYVHHEVPHTRAGFARTKIAHPRIWDVKRTKRWTDQLKMPRFNFRMDDGEEVSTRASVAGIVLGLVDEPIKPGVFYHPDAAARDIIKFRRVVDRYGCDNCHPIEGQASVLWKFLGAPLDVAPDEEPPPMAAGWDLQFVPPNLFGEGERVQADWLLRFLKDPTDLRPKVRYRMPKFELTDEEADALVAGFQRLAGIKIRNRYQQDSGIAGRTYKEPVRIVVKDDTGREVAAREVRDAVAEAEFLFESINCNKCHLPLGSPGADPKDGGVSPPFRLAKERLNRAWVNVLLNEPNHVIRNTAMIDQWPRSGYGRTVNPQHHGFQFQLRDDPEWQRLWQASEQGKKAGPEKDEATKRLAEVQREALADYAVHHYRDPRPAAEPR